MQLIEINDSWLNKIEILRESEVEGGFQRKLAERRANDIAKYMSNGHKVPPIYVGKIGDRYVCIDGQHRLEARKKKEFSLFAIISETDMKTAAEEFEAMNTMASKVPLVHRLKISNIAIAKFIRACAKKYDCDVRLIFSFIKGITGRWSPLLDFREGFPSETKEQTEIFFDIWTKDKRWRSKKSVFSKQGTLQVIGNLCRNKSNASIKKVLNKCLELDFYKPGVLFSHYGSGGTNQKYMKEYIIRKLFNGMME